jgi:glycolate oxidase FAD binding subunit
MTKDSLLDAAARAVGGAAVRPATDADRIDGTLPSIVIAPTSAEAVAATLSWAARESLSVVVQGGGTKAEWSQPSASIDIALSTAGLSRIIDHADGDLTVTVEAGAVFDRVNAVLGERRQWLPLDPAASDRATIGGVLATNDSGPSRHRHGTPADLVLGVTLVTSDGVIGKAGGRVVKNVAGYDLGRLMAGSHGELAVITSATFRLAPRPTDSATAVLSAGSVAPLSAAAAELTTRQIEPAAVELQAAGSTPTRTLLVRFATDRPTVDAGLSEARAIAQRAGAAFEEARDAADSTLWREHEARPWHARTVIRVSWLPAELDKAVSAIADAAGTPGWQLCARAGVGSGHIGLDGSPESLPAVVARLRGSSVLGNVVIVKGPAALRSAAGTWGPRPSAAPLWRPLKQSWDPANVLGAGRGPR